jgi:hypothetical protein
MYPGRDLDSPIEKIETEIRNRQTPLLNQLRYHLLRTGSSDAQIQLIPFQQSFW